MCVCGGGGHGAPLFHGHTMDVNGGGGREGAPSYGNRGEYLQARIGRRWPLAGEGEGTPGLDL